MTNFVTVVGNPKAGSRTLTAAVELTDALASLLQTVPALGGSHRLHRRSEHRGTQPG